MVNLKQKFNKLWKTDVSPPSLTLPPFFIKADQDRTNQIDGSKDAR